MLVPGSHPSVSLELPQVARVFSMAIQQLFAAQVPLYGQATGLSRDLQKKLADLQVRVGHLVLLDLQPAALTKPSVPTSPYCACLQRTRADMDSIWRMQTLSNAGSKQDIWKRCGSCLQRFALSAKLHLCSEFKTTDRKVYRKVEQVSEETDSLDLAFNRHITRQRR